MLVEFNGIFLDISKISYVSKIINERFPLYYIIIDGIEKKIYNDKIPREEILKVIKGKEDGN